jgi:DNA-directed RNA polymerase specialized sigma24 family protein
MHDDNRRKIFESKILPNLHDLRLTSIWLTKTRRKADELMRKTLNRAFKLWRPSLSKSDFRLLLFRLLTVTFFDEIQSRPTSLSTSFERKIGPIIFGDRLISIDEDPGSDIKRVIVRLPIEVAYINFLSKLDGFSAENIGDIVGVKPDGTDSWPEHGSRLLNSEPFTYSGEG